MDKPLRFGVSIVPQPNMAKWTETARRVEDHGFDILVAPDHLKPQMMAPLPALMAALAATRTLRTGTLVLNNLLRRPTILAREVATIECLWPGRFELGIGAGYGRIELARAGVELPPASPRARQLEESVEVMKALWSGQPATLQGDYNNLAGLHHGFDVGGAPIPLVIGGNSGLILDVAARHADTVSFIGIGQSEKEGRLNPNRVTYADLAEQVTRVRATAGDRFNQIELSILVQEVIITDDRSRAAHSITQWMPADVGAILDSPYFFIGSTQAIKEQVGRLRESLGISYFTVFGPSMSSMEQIIHAI